MELETITFIIPLLYQLPLTPDSTTGLWETILELDDNNSIMNDSYRGSASNWGVTFAK